MAKKGPVLQTPVDECIGVAVTKALLCLLLLAIFFSGCKPTGDITLEGYSATSPGIFSTITPIAFGVVAAGSSGTQVITLTNSGGAEITLGTITNAVLGLTAPLQLDSSSTCATGKILKALDSCLIVIAFAATPVGAYAQTLKLNYHDGGLNKILAVSISGTARPIASNITPAAFNEDTQSATITLSYNGGTNASSCALSSLSNVAVTQSCACVVGVCTVKVTGTANYFGAAGFGYTVTANGVASNTASATFTINSINDDPVLTVPNNRLYPLDGSDEPILQGTQSTFTSSTTDVENDTITYSCTYTTPYLDVSDVNYAAPATACTSLTSSTFSTSTSALVWRPTNRQKGIYKFTILATDSNAGTDSDFFYVTVREPFTTSNLLAAYDAAYSDVTYNPRLDGTGNDDMDSWLDLTPNDITASLAGFSTSAPWAGVGTFNNPYRLTFNGTNDSMSVDAALGANTKMMFSTWLSPGNAAAKDKIILGNGGGSGNGFVLQQSQTVAGKIELAVGAKTYKDVILSDAPSVYYQLNEGSGSATIADTMGNSTGTLSNVTLGAAGVVTNTSASFSKALDSHITFPPPPGLSSTHSVEMWINPAIVNSGSTINMMLFDSGAGNNNAVSVYNSGSGSIRLRSYTGVIMDSVYQFPTANIWYHIVVTRDFGGINSMYINGVLDSQQTLPLVVPVSPLYLNRYGGALGYSGDTLIDEFALYNYALSPAQVRAHYDAAGGIFYPNPTLAARPIHYWPLGESSGVVALDLGSNGNNATYVGAPTLGVAGPATNGNDTAITVNGTSSYVATTAAVTLPLTVSISAWLKTTAGGQAAIFSNRSGNHATYFGRSGGSAFIYDNQTGGFGGGAGLNNGAWHHLVWTANATTSTFYIDGNMVSSGAFARTASAATIANFGRDPELNEFYNGSLDEIAIYDHLLTAREVANIYSYGAAWKCVSRTSFANSAWKFVSGLWDGTSLSLFVNGREECKIAPAGMTFSPGLSPNIYGGASPSNSKNWQGSITDLKIYGGSGTGSVGSATVVKNDFNVTANQFRAVPVPDIVTNGLLLNLDAANANAGLGFPGCAGPAPLSVWPDLSDGSGDATLQKFSTCTTYGWQGTGIPADPYRLVFNGAVKPYVTAHHLAGLSGSFTVEFWVNPASLIDYNQVFAAKGGWGEFVFHATASGSLYCGTSFAAVFSPADIPAGTVVVGQWHHFVYSYNSSTGMGNLYKNGALIAGPRAQAAPIPWTGFNFGNPADTIDGSVAKVAVYNIPLTQAQVRQNCKALEARFLGFTCL
ncbi:MAG: hypothetical protein A2X86_01775 [Bdellovibrionales bacterium GWA2_49_15]|nr:MAG: hypothetical protein A2X86_01775 [Bdellovibrionales bacterium GWA2_49_15]